MVISVARNSNLLSFKNRDRAINLGLMVSFLRKKAGMTQEQLAEKAGISRGYLGEIEAPNMLTNITLEIILNLADALDATPDLLFHEMK